MELSLFRRTTIRAAEAFIRQGSFLARRLLRGTARPAAPVWCVCCKYPPSHIAVCFAVPLCN
jgi:hypothetical protein